MVNKRYFGNGRYITIIAPEEFPGYKYKNKYCYEHHYIYWLNTGLIPIKGESEIHHIDGDTRNNSFENLILKRKDKHFLTHMNSTGLIGKFRCPNCGVIFTKPTHRTHLSPSSKAKVTFCSQKCAGKRNQYNPVLQDEIDSNVIDVYQIRYGD